MQVPRDRGFRTRCARWCVPGLLTWGAPRPPLGVPLDAPGPSCQVHPVFTHQHHVASWERPRVAAAWTRWAGGRRSGAVRLRPRRGRHLAERAGLSGACLRTSPGSRGPCRGHDGISGSRVSGQRSGQGCRYRAEETSEQRSASGAGGSERPGGLEPREAARRLRRSAGTHVAAGARHPQNHGKGCLSQLSPEPGG